MVDKAQDVKEKYEWNMLKIPSSGRYDVMALGALIYRLDPGQESWDEAEDFKVHVSGAEYNPAANCRRYDLKTAVLTGMADYCIGDLIAARLRKVGVDIIGPMFSHNPWGVHHATVYSSSPGGCAMNFVDYNRSNESAVVVKPGMYRYEKVFEGGVRWVHCGGLFATLGPDTQALMIEYYTEGKKQGAVRSLDLNFRGKLVECKRGKIEVVRGSEYLDMDAFNREYGGEISPVMDKAKFIDTMRNIVSSVDVMFTNETDMQNALGLEPTVKSKSKDPIQPEVIASVQQRALDTFNNLEIVVTSLRDELNNTNHRWGAVATIRGHKDPYIIKPEMISVADRIGGGDGVAGGFISAVFYGLSPEEALKAGWVSGALVASYRGDITQAKWEDVLAKVKGGLGAKVKR